MSVAIIDYGSGNLHSAAKAFERAARDSGLPSGSRDGSILKKSESRAHRAAGVGAFKDCRDGLKSIPGMWEALEDEVIRRSKPFLGICVGMQLMASRGLEHDVTEGFGWIPGDVKPISRATSPSRSRTWAGTRSSCKASRPARRH
jgi:imidazole glycerol-phosphate synthase subunit HisH